MSPLVLEPSAAVSERRRRPWLRGLACVALVYHLAAITMANVSRTTALGTAFHRPFDPYLALFRLDQSWDMFTTIPHYLDMGGHLVAIDANGVETNYGPLLPDFRPYPKDPRFFGTFLRLAFYAQGYPGYSVRYLVAVCRAITVRTGKVPAKVAFQLATQELRPMQDIRADGRIAQSRVMRFGPVPCPR